MDTSPKTTNEEGQSWIEYLDHSLGHHRTVPFTHSSWTFNREEDTDDKLKDEVLKQLYQSPKVDASFIHVDVINGHVLLTGRVFSEGARLEASKVLETIGGVWSHQNDLCVILTS